MGESLHQDLLDAGGLGAALEARCPDAEIEMYPGAGLFDGFGAKVRQGDRGVRIQPLRGEDRCSISYSLRGHSMHHVYRTVFAEIIDSAATWLGGATPEEFAQAWPFAGFVDVAAAFESGDRIELAWQHFRLSGPFELGAFVEAAMREPRLRRMCPFTSMWWMSFRPTADEYLVPGPWVRSAHNGRYTVVVNRREEPTIDHDAETAVRLVLAEMDRIGVPGPDEIDSYHVAPAYRATEQRRKLDGGDRSATCYPDRRALGYAVEFRWRDERIAYGWAPDPAGATGAAEDWVGGVSPRELARTWPFADFVAAGEAFERGDLLEYEWLQARAHARYGVRELVEAAMREPRLRRWYPVVGINALRFWADWHVVRKGPIVTSVGDGRYKIHGEHGDELGQGDVDHVLRVCLAEVSPEEPPSP
ncbi:DUF6193 family natural product biosynthesis protein [Kutzneria buriramensis]|uniref:Uncharacterized protein n=1 Tax=Kutzneria buriramensis TaxID=1045776 RepID=A0A3E0HNS2_9PSEU|nr:DUF6193 family natural product biosynthesis protein [Kutzneria buriramensis]REH48153.1 hypothetical protein BCF44_10511 [Kutzneria buriramensis]